MAKRKNVDLAAELGEDIDLTEDEAKYYAEDVPAPPAVETPVSAPAMSVTVADIQAIVRAAVEASASGNQAIADSVTAGIAQARKAIPEGTDQSYHQISVLNPLGEKDHPRPGLRCEFFLGTKDAKTGVVTRNYPWVADDLTANEQIALNTLEPMAKTIDLLDGTHVKVELLPTRDALTNEITRMVLVIPQFVIEKKSQHKNMLPNLCHIVEQLTGHNYAKLSKDDLAWFMAEHRKKNYVAVREAVAA